MAYSRFSFFFRPRYGTWMFTVGGVMLLAAAAFIVMKSRKHNQ